MDTPMPLLCEDKPMDAREWAELEANVRQLARPRTSRAVRLAGAAFLLLAFTPLYGTLSRPVTAAALLASLLGLGATILLHKASMRRIGARLAAENPSRREQALRVVRAGRSMALPRRAGQTTAWLTIDSRSIRIRKHPPITWDHIHGTDLRRIRSRSLDICWLVLLTRDSEDRIDIQRHRVDDFAELPEFVEGLTSTVWHEVTGRPQTWRAHFTRAETEFHVAWDTNDRSRTELDSLWRAAGAARVRSLENGLLLIRLLTPFAILQLARLLLLPTVNFVASEEWLLFSLLASVFLAAVYVLLGVRRVFPRGTPSLLTFRGASIGVGSTFAAAVLGWLFWSPLVFVIGDPFSRLSMTETERNVVAHKKEDHSGSCRYRL
ncbi:MAG: hypothetical protein ABW136_10370, partial [Steroidobacteraceae bacterium]